jgi:hypothetical protein
MMTKAPSNKESRFRLENRLLNQLKRILKEEPITQVVGKLDLIQARCCKEGTYAIVRIGRDGVKKQRKQG